MRGTIYHSLCPSHARTEIPVLLIRSVVAVLLIIRNVLIIRSVIHSCPLMFQLRSSQTEGETLPS